MAKRAARGKSGSAGKKSSATSAKRKSGTTSAKRRTGAASAKRKSGATSAKKKTGATRRRKVSSRRELIDTGTDKRYVRRNKSGQFKESDDVGRSLSADRRRKAKTKAKKGQGDRGD